MEKNYYDKKIVYLDYLERGEKIKNAGYVKWEVKNKECRIQIHIRGLYTTDTLQGEIILLTKTQNQSADTMQLRYGTGEYTGKWESENLAGTGIAYETCQGIRIKLSESRRLETVWGESAELQISEEKAVVEAGKNVSEPMIVLKEDATSDSALPQKEMNDAVDEPIIIEDERNKEEEQATIHMQERSEEQVTIHMQERSGEQEPITPRKEYEQIFPTVKEEVEHTTVTIEKKVEEAECSKTIEDSEQRDTSGQHDTKCKPERLSGDKWVQLNRIYPHIRPFGDKREYLSVGPRDFVVLTRRYQNLVQNSFLLHGYYNYGHVILTRIREGEEDVFYLGVPGVYYEREKQAALMFGFEGFESGNEVAGEGGFGYYMKRVDI